MLRVTLSADGNPYFGSIKVYPATSPFAMSAAKLLKCLKIGGRFSCLPSPLGTEPAESLCPNDHDDGTRARRCLLHSGDRTRARFQKGARTQDFSLPCKALIAPRLLSSPPEEAA